MSKASKTTAKTETVETVQNGKDRTPRTLTSGASFHDFESEPEIEGVYKEPVIAEKDNEQRQQKAGDVIGYLFENEESEFIVGNSHSVKKAIEQVEPGAKLSIKFLGKGESNGKPFNKFKIDLLGYVGE